MTHQEFKIRIIWYIRGLLEAGFSAHYKEVKQLLGKTKGLVLDLGCGIGNFSKLFRAKQYIGVDCDPALIAFAKKHNPGTFIRADAKKIPFPSEHFDAVLLVGVLHHLKDEDLPKVVAEIFRVTKKGGTVLVVEDYRPDIAENAFIHFLYNLDRGGNFRKPQVYRRLFSRRFLVKSESGLISGLWRYRVFTLKKEKIA